LKQVTELFDRLFNYDFEKTYAAKIIHTLENKTEYDYEPILIVADDENQNVKAFTYCVYFPDVKYAYLDYIASLPEEKSKGIGGALYEALREFLANKGAKGIFLEAYSYDTGSSLKKEQNLRRAKFYEKFGAYPILNPVWAEVSNKYKWDITHLYFDGLGYEKPLTSKEVKKAVKRILVTLYDYRLSDDFIRKIVDSFKDNPVRFKKINKKNRKPHVKSFDSKIKPLKIFKSFEFKKNHEKSKGYYEKPAKSKLILKGIPHNSYETENIITLNVQEVLEVHDKNMVQSIENFCRKISSDRCLYIETFSNLENRHESISDLNLSYYCKDAITPFTKDTYTDALLSASVSAKAAASLIEGNRFVYSLNHLPGHIAGKKSFGGYSYFNNGAIAASILAKIGKTVILDIDFHHFSGTQDIFYSRNDVLTISIHGNPKNHYPFFTGTEEETGEGDGKGFNFNFPLKAMCGENKYLDTLDRAIPLILCYKPLWLIVCIGFDVMKNDPTGNFGLSDVSMQKIAQKIGKLSLPTLFIQEGAYNSSNQIKGAKAFFSGILESY
jgi:acetoin utilization deacetylase AcuC-like enzyme/GNAT superfamily N-acetyltransferase